MFQINQLIIIGGPSCAGKTFLIEKIRQGDCTRLCEQLGIAIPSEWLYIDAFKLPLLRQPIIERLCVHYDFHAQYSQKNGFNFLYDLIINSGSVTILTLSVSPKILIQRITSRLFKLFVSLLYDHKAYIRKLRRLRRLWKTRKIYQDGFRVSALFEEWFNFFDECSVTSHWLLDSSRPNIMMAHPYKHI